jgi:hypothetical protein
MMSFGNKGLVHKVALWRILARFDFALSVLLMILAVATLAAFFLNITSSHELFCTLAGLSSACNATNKESISPKTLSEWRGGAQKADLDLQLLKTLRSGVCIVTMDFTCSN